jgi:signal transduction histidine kinase
MKPVRLRSCLVTQLVVQDEVLGILSYYRQDIHTFSLEEVSLLVAVAEQLGISLDNQRLRQEAEQAAVHSERQRLARELHDSVTQSLYGLTLFSRAGQDALQVGDNMKLATSLEQIEQNTNLALNEMRLMLYQMKTQSLEMGLFNEVNTRLDQVERRLGIEATCQINDQVVLPAEVEMALFRITLEALNNSLKHARASHVHVLLEPQAAGLLLEVSDDGHGFDYSNQVESLNNPGMGLRNMQERAVELNGRLEILSYPGKGTRVRLFVPEQDNSERSGR